MKKTSQLQLFLAFLFVSVLLNRELKAQSINTANGSSAENNVPLKISGTNTVYKMLTTGVNSIDGKSTGISIYPNPFTSSTRFEFAKKNTNSKYSILIYDITGTLIKEVNNITASYYDLNKDDMKPQIYYYRILDDSKKPIGTGKLVLME